MSMKSYLPHLLTDLRQAHRPDGDGPGHPATLQQEIEEMERWMFTGPEATFREEMQDKHFLPST